MRTRSCCNLLMWSTFSSLKDHSLMSKAWFPLPSMVKLHSSSAGVYQAKTMWSSCPLLLVFCFSEPLSAASLRTSVSVQSSPIFVVSRKMNGCQVQRSYLQNFCFPGKFKHYWVLFHATEFIISKCSGCNNSTSAWSSVFWYDTDKNRSPES